MTAPLPLQLPPGVSLEDIKACLRYDFGRTHWAALVVAGDDGFDLYISQGGSCMPSGTFRTSKALMKFVREKATERFPDHYPAIDTLDKLKGRTAHSVVPECYDRVAEERAGGKGKESCPSCPYRHNCGVPTPEELGLTGPVADDEEVQETEEDLMKRVRAKLKKMKRSG